MGRIQKYQKSFWRVPLISLIAGWLYIPCYVRVVLRFGVVEPGVIDSKVSLWTDGGLFIAFLLLGGVIFLRNQTRREIFVSASIVVGYGLCLRMLQFLSGSVTGPAAVVFMRLASPLEWMGFPSSLGRYLEEQFSLTVPLVDYLQVFVPWLFVLFGRRNTAPAAAVPSAGWSGG